MSSMQALWRSFALYETQLPDARVLFLRLERVRDTLQPHTEEFFDHWLFQHVDGSYSKYSAPRMLSCGDGGLGGNVGIPTGCWSSAFLRIDFTL